MQNPRLTLICVALGGATSMLGCSTEGVAGPVQVTAWVNDFAGLRDAAPSPDSNHFYFVALSSGKGALFDKNLIANTAPLELTSGFVDPRGVSASTDGANVFVADPGAANGGALFAVSSKGGAPAVVMGTAGLAPAGLDVASENGADVIYFVGVDAADHEPALFSLPATGGTATVVSKGFTGIALEGVAAGAPGTEFVSGVDANGDGAVFSVSAGTPTRVLDHFVLGSPGGIALTKDGASLFVSAIDSATKTSKVLVLDTAEKTTSSFNDVINANSGSGGVHRAFVGDTFAYAGFAQGGAGTVYSLAMKSSASPPTE